MYIIVGVVIHLHEQSRKFGRKMVQLLIKEWRRGC
jgi:hypothetical protein